MDWHGVEQESEQSNLREICGLVESYFGELIDDIAINHRISKQELIVLLGKTQLKLSEFYGDRFGRIEQDPTSNLEEIVALNSIEQEIVKDCIHAHPFEWAFVTEVHRPMVEALIEVEDLNTDEDVFILLRSPRKQ